MASGSSLTADVAVVGGGVAGSSLAAALARAGLGVVVIKREPHFRDRVRGEGLMPWGVDEADRLGLLPVLQSAGAISMRCMYVYDQSEMVAEIDLLSATPSGRGGLNVFHPHLQQALTDHAAAMGAAILRPAQATRYRSGSQSELTVRTTDGDITVRARLVVGADGRTSLARRWASVQTIRDPVRYMIGGGLVEGDGLATDGVHTGSYDGWMLIHFPLANRRGRSYIACLDATARELMGASNRDQFVPTLVRAVPKGAMDTWNVVGPVAFFPNADIWTTHPAGNGVALVGDAAGANDPVIGQGLSLSFRDARQLRDLLLTERDWSGALEAYADERNRYYQVMRAYALWSSTLGIEQGPEADARREHVRKARQIDPSMRELLGLPHRGPDGVVLDEDARRRYFGEHIPVER